MSLTKLPMGRNNSVMTSLFPPRESLVVPSRLGTENSRTFFYGVAFAVQHLSYQDSSNTLDGTLPVIFGSSNTLYGKAPVISGFLEYSFGTATVISGFLEYPL